MAMRMLISSALVALVGLLSGPSFGAGGPVLAAGFQHSVALDRAGQLLTWGSDTNGQLAAGRLLNAVSPQRVSPAATFVKTAAGDAHSLAIRSDGTLWAWGDNRAGQLGDGSLVSRTAPVQIGAGFVAVAAGDRHSLALKADGSLWAWGDNGYGQLGDGSRVSRRTPVNIGGGYRAISACGDTSLALSLDGGLWRWGGLDNTNQDGTFLGPPVPVKVGAGYSAIAAGYDTYVALKPDGSYWRGSSSGWGVRDAPTQVGVGAVAIASGAYHRLALLTDGTVLAWGANDAGQLGDGTRTSRDAAQPARVGSGFMAISAGAHHSLAVTRDRVLWSWGRNFEGQLGDGGNTDRLAPVQAGASLLVDSVSGGSGHTVAVASDGGLWAWGNNQAGQVGTGAPSSRSSPVVGGTGFVDVAAGTSHNLALKSDGSLWSWGSNNFGQLGDGGLAVRSVPAQVGQDFVKVAAGTFHSLGIKNDGTVWAWGLNAHGELGEGSTRNRSVPTAVTPTSLTYRYTAVAAGLEFSLALKADGSLYAWGLNTDGQLGDGTTAERLRPALVTGGGYAAVAAGHGHVLALKSDGSLWAWGRNVSGQLGDGTTTNRLSPVMIGSGFTAISAGYAHSLALKGDGTLWAWGSNAQRALGDGGQANDANCSDPPCIKKPRQVGAGFQAIAAGAYHSLALTARGGVLAWGNNAYGQLGNGSYSDAPVPTNVNNPSITDQLVLTGAAPSLADLLLPYFLKAELNGASLTATLTDLRAAGLLGEVYFTALLPANSPLVSTSGTRAPGGAVRQRTLSSGAARRQNTPATAQGMVAGALTRGGFKQTGGTGYVTADPAYNGDLGRASALEVYAQTADPLANSAAVICMGVTVPSLSAKGQVLMRPIATGTDVKGVAQCPPVQTASTSAMFRAEATGPLNARTIVAVYNPLDEDRGRTLKVFAWAVAPDGRQFMQTGPNQWESMSEPMRAASTLVVPQTGSSRIEITRSLDLSGLEGTLLFIGIGDRWEDVRSFNRAGHPYTVQ